MLLFGAAYACAAPNKGTTILYCFSSQSTILRPTENSRIQKFSRPLSVFPVLFKADLIFKDFSSKPSKFKCFSSLCEPCALEHKVWKKKLDINNNKISSSYEFSTYCINSGDSDKPGHTQSLMRAFTACTNKVERWKAAHVCHL